MGGEGGRGKQGGRGKEGGKEGGKKVNLYSNNQPYYFVNFPLCTKLSVCSAASNLQQICPPPHMPCPAYCTDLLIS